MHEFSLAESILSAALKEAERHKAKKIKKMFIEVGELSMAGLEQLEFALKSLAEGTIAEGMNIKLYSVPGRFKCDRGHVSRISLNGMDMFLGLTTMRCPKCGSNLKVISGKECVLKKIVAE